LDFLVDAKGFSSMLDLDSSTTNCDTHIGWAFSNIFDNSHCAHIWDNE